VTTSVDGGGAVRAWVNSLTSTLVGEGHPLQLGAALKIREGAATVPYGFLVELTGYLWGGHESPDFAQRISMQVYGPTRESAADGARAYHEELIPLLLGTRAVLPGLGISIVGVDNIDGPQWFPDGDEPRYVVDADFLFQRG
jgi:hypothetical protein